MAPARDEQLLVLLLPSCLKEDPGVFQALGIPPELSFPPWEGLPAAKSCPSSSLVSLPCLALSQSKYSQDFARGGVGSSAAAGMGLMFGYPGLRFVYPQLGRGNGVGSGTEGGRAASLGVVGRVWGRRGGAQGGAEQCGADLGTLSCLIPRRNCCCVSEFPSCAPCSALLLIPAQIPAPGAETSPICCWSVG